MRLALILSLFIGSIAQAGPLVLRNDRTITVTGIIETTTLRHTRVMVALAKISKDPITLVIDSPGGSAIVMEHFVDVMEGIKAAGVPIDCVVPTMAASAAFSILAHCSKRYATANAKLLFHPGSVSMMMATLNEESTEMLRSALNAINKRIRADLQRSLKMDQREFDVAWKEERLWTATELKAAATPGWITIVEGVLPLEHLISGGK